MNNMIGSCPAKQFQFVQSHACLHSKTLFIIKFYWFKLVPIVADSMYIYKPMSSMWRRQQTCIWCHMSIYISMWVPDHNWLGFFFFAKFIHLASPLDQCVWYLAIAFQCNWVGLMLEALNGNIIKSSDDQKHQTPVCNGLHDAHTHTQWICTRFLLAKIAYNIMNCKW